MTWVDELIMQYNAESRLLEQYRDKLDKEDPEDIEEAKTVSEMLSDMRYSLEWMKRGRRPGSRRGIDRTNVYRQREVFGSIKPVEVQSEADRLRIIECLLTLSERERACWLLHMAHGLTQEHIADRLKLSRASVRIYINRAKQKLESC